MIFGYNIGKNAQNAEKWKLFIFDKIFLSSNIIFILIKEIKLSILLKILMNRVKYFSEHTSKRQELIIPMEGNPYQLSFKIPSIGKAKALTQFTQNLLMRKELQMARLFKYLPSISSNILQQQFDCELPLICHKRQFLEKLMGKPIDLHALNLKTQKKNEKRTKTMDEIEGNSDKMLGNHSAERNFEKNMKNHTILPRISSKNRKNASFQAKKVENNKKEKKIDQKEESSTILAIGKTIQKMENKKNSNIFKLIEPTRFEVKRGNSYDRDDDLEDYVSQLKSTN